MNQYTQERQEICEIGRRIWQRGFCGGNEGNHSVRVDEDHVLCTPTGVSKGFMTPEMICLSDMQGNQIDQNTYRLSSEVRIHLALYRARPDVKAVIHSHPSHALAFAMNGIPLPEGIHPEAEVFLGRVPLADYGTPSTDELADTLLPHLENHTNSIIMQNHGVVCFEKSLTEAYYRLEILDNYCKALLLSTQLGGPSILNHEKMEHLLEIKKQFGIADNRTEEDTSPEGLNIRNALFFSAIGK
jgi:L-fuculose-phosphate aldolase